METLASELLQVLYAWAAGRSLGFTTIHHTQHFNGVLNQHKYKLNEFFLLCPVLIPLTIREPQSKVTGLLFNCPPLVWSWFVPNGTSVIGKRVFWYVRPQNDGTNGTGEWFGANHFMPGLLLMDRGYQRYGWEMA
ncbi:hypothetical protein NPIL_663141 [Nephila pilipes]|uniref:Uncharacterized protein n=1 Tax=Nephila pilipes TaxID=299642 RepID=A0A8X6Q4G3_NEPPI|nr:hypothetical protein NPIL_663141 [Nephila pilipes]